MLREHLFLLLFEIFLNMNEEEGEEAGCGGQRPTHTSCTQEAERKLSEGVSMLHRTGRHTSVPQGSRELTG